VDRRAVHRGLTQLEADVVHRQAVDGAIRAVGTRVLAAHRARRNALVVREVHGAAVRAGVATMRRVAGLADRGENLLVGRLVGPARREHDDHAESLPHARTITPKPAAWAIERERSAGAPRGPSSRNRALRDRARPWSAPG